MPLFSALSNAVLRLRPLLAAAICSFPWGQAPAQLCALPPPAGGALRDGDFERKDLELRRNGNPGSWCVIVHREGRGTVSLAPGEGRGSSVAACYRKSDELSQNIHFDQVVPVKPHTLYEASAWMRGEGTLRPGLVIYTPKWKPLAAGALSASSSEWSLVRVVFDSGSCDQVRFAWIPGQRGDRHEACPGASYLDEAAVTELVAPPDALRQALKLVRSREGEEIGLSGLRPAAVETPAGLLPIRCQDGVLVYPGGGEVALWGVNFQTPLAWEYQGRLKAAGVPLEAEALRQVTDRNLAEIQELGCDLVRIHLCPSDFTGARGELVSTVYLEALDHLLARCAETRTRVYLTLINDMNQRTCPGSFLNGQSRESWFFDAALREKLERYAGELLSRTNPASGRCYAKEPALAAIEIANEPSYPDELALLAEPGQARLRTAFETWCQGRELDRWPNAAFALWRYETVGEAIRRLVAVIRAAGAEQPIFWNLNWPGMINGHEDVFQAVAESPVDGVSVCLYPGQQDVEHPFWAHPVDLDGKNYLPFLRRNLADYDKLRWMMGKRFAGKAKAVYEFETFYTQNSHLYPAMARVMRALGVQMAPMWTYTLSPSAERHSGSHHLNLYCTPRKAVSFAIAARLFRATPRHAPYPEGDDRELVFDGRCLVSFPRDLSVWQSGDSLLHSRTIDRLPFGEGGEPIRHIFACGSSPLVSYEGSGSYAVAVSGEILELRMNPDARFLRPHWERPPSRNSLEKSCLLDWDVQHLLKLALPVWRAGDSFRLERWLDGEFRPVAGARGTGEFLAAAGRYRIQAVRGKGSADRR